MALIPYGGTPVADIPEPQNFEAVPPGKRLAIVLDGGMEDTEKKKNGTGIGEFLKLEFQIVEGPNTGAHLWERFNLVNENTTAVDIAFRELGALCRALGLPTIPADTAELVNKPVVLDVGIEHRKDPVTKKPDLTKDPQNKIKAYLPASTWNAAAAAAAPAPAAYTPPAAATPAATPAARPAGGKPPWAK
jgi:hypothetical protein